MSTWRARLAVGHLATAVVVGIAGGIGALGSWWVPVGATTLVAGLVAAVEWWRVAPQPATELGRMAAALTIPTVTTKA